MGSFFEIIEVESEVVTCSGNGGGLGHPAVYLNLMPNGEVTCPYCSKHYVRVMLTKA